VGARKKCGGPELQTALLRLRLARSLPGSMALTENTQAGASRSWTRDLLILLLVFGALYFFRLGSYPLSNPDEGRNAEVPREMLVSGDWVTPRLDGVNYFEKPPLVYWVTATFEKTFGLNEWSVRAVPALFALAGILLTYAAARALYDRATGWLSAAVLGTCLLWFVIGHIPILDTAVSVFMSGTLLCFLLAVREPAGSRRRWLFMGLYACAALATLTKGLMGFLVTGAVMFLWLLVFNQWKRLRPLYLPTGILLFLLIALPWHILAAQRNETWFHRYVVFEHFLRFLTPAASRTGPWHYFIWVVIAGMVPWTGFLWPRVREMARAGWAGRSTQLATGFFLTWTIFIVLFFSVSKSKLVPYVLPVFPALAILAGVELAQAWRHHTADRVRVGFRFFVGFAGLLAVALALLVLRPSVFKGLDPAQAEAVRVPAIVLIAVLVVGAIAVPRLARQRGARTAIAALGAVMVAFYGTLEFAAPAINKPGTKELALWVQAHAAPQDRVFHCYDFYQDFTFYAGRVVGVVGSNHAELELSEDAAARASGRFISDTELLAQWGGAGRIFLVVQKRKIEQIKQSYAAGLEQWSRAAEDAKAHGRAFSAPPPERPVFADPSFHSHLIAETPYYYLLSNRP
jgi:4-amino-4-deoxy-L-arabinose transferase-like glycosyltransferase